ncbi:MAG: hypothetical protein GW760_03155 [Legionella sp.]|nr:hypothetical protein [Legionella sp.]
MLSKLLLEPSRQDSIKRIKDLDTLIEQEKMRLRATGEKKLSKTYQDLIKERQHLDSSPRSVGSLPSSPTGEIKHRSLLDMRLNFLSQSPKEKTQPIPIPRENDERNSEKLAYGVSALEESYLLRISRSRPV